MKNQYLKTVYLILIIIILIAPVTQMNFDLIPEVTLGGVEFSKVKPEFNFAAWRKGDFQKEFSNWFEQNLGLRGYLVRTYNQMLYSVFKETPRQSIVAVAKDRVLYERGYIDEYLDTEPPPQAELETNVVKIKELQSQLAARGTTLLVVITPSKVAIYPEFIPDNRKQTRAGKERGYDRFVSLLDKHQVNYVDGHAITLAEKGKTSYPLFCKGGTHWNFLGVFFTARQLVKTIEELRQEDLVNIEMAGIGLTDGPQGTNRDLVNGLNVWFPPIDYIAPYPYLSLVKNGRETRPSILLIGGSFNWQLLEILGVSEVFSKLDIFYYYNRKTSYPRGYMREITRIDWQKEIFSTDVIVLEVNESKVYSVGQSNKPNEIHDNFIDDALKELGKTTN